MRLFKIFMDAKMIPPFSQMLLAVNGYLPVETFTPVMYPMVN